MKKAIRSKRIPAAIIPTERAVCERGVKSYLIHTGFLLPYRV
jgi:hypothetical protein